jgi:hypothetical protein
MIEDFTAKEARTLTDETRDFKGFTDAERRAWNEAEIRTLVDEIKLIGKTDPNVDYVDCNFSSQENIDWFIRNGFTVTHLVAEGKARPGRFIGRSMAFKKWRVSW